MFKNNNNTWWCNKIFFHCGLGEVQQLLCTVPFNHRVVPQLQLPVCASIQHRRTHTTGLWWATTDFKGAICKMDSLLVVAVPHQHVHRNKPACRPHLPLYLCFQQPWTWPRTSLFGEEFQALTDLNSLVTENYTILKKRTSRQDGLQPWQPGKYCFFCKYYT